MNDRMIELLANAAKCFHEIRSPFSHSELLKMNVTADECKDLLDWIGDILDDYLEAPTLFRPSASLPTDEVKER